MLYTKWCATIWPHHLRKTSIVSWGGCIIRQKVRLNHYTQDIALESVFDLPKKFITQEPGCSSSSDEDKSTTQPRFVTGGELRPYQLKGLAWLKVKWLPWYHHNSNAFIVVWLIISLLVYQAISTVFIFQSCHLFLFEWIENQLFNLNVVRFFFMSLISFMRHLKLFICWHSILGQFHIQTCPPCGQILLVLSLIKADFTKCFVIYRSNY